MQAVFCLQVEGNSAYCVEIIISILGNYLIVVIYL